MQDGIAVMTKGLTPGERVVVDGQYRLTNGARVKVAATARRERRASLASDRPFTAVASSYQSRRSR